MLNKLEITKSDFQFLFTIGKGGYGIVWKVLFKKENKCYAMK